MKSAAVGVEDVEAKKQVLLEKLREAEDKLKLLEREADGLRKLIDSLDRAVRKGIEAFSAAILTRGVSEERLSDFLNGASRKRREVASELVGKEREICTLKDDIKKINVLLEGESERVLELGAIEVSISCDHEGRYEFILQYDVRDAGWVPVYDVVLGKQANFDFYAEA